MSPYPKPVAMLQAGQVTVPAAISDGTNPSYPISGFAVQSSPLVEVGSDSGAQLQNVMITGIAFEYSSWVDPSFYGYMADQDGYFTLDENLSLNDNAAPGMQIQDEATMQIAAVRIENATHAAINGNVFEHLGGAGLEIYHRSSSNTISGNTFSDISGNGIIVDGSPVDSANADGSPQHPFFAGLGHNPVAVSSSDTISQNTISTIGAAFPDSCPILASYTDSLTISHNDMHDIPAMGVVLGVAHGGLVTIGVGNIRMRTSYTVANVEWNNIYEFGEMLQDGGGVYVDGPNWDGLARVGTIVENNYIHDNPLSQAYGSKDAVSSWCVYLDSNANGATVASTDLFDIRAGSGLAAEFNHKNPIGAKAGAVNNVLGRPIDSSTIINDAGPVQTNDLNDHWSYTKPPPSLTQSFALPYAGTYELALRVANVVGAGCAVEVSNPGVAGSFTFSLTPASAPHSVLLPLSFSVSEPMSLAVELTFAGGRSASMILEKVWLVPTLVDPYAS